MEEAGWSLLIGCRFPSLVLNHLHSFLPPICAYDHFWYLLKALISIARYFTCSVFYLLRTNSVIYHILNFSAVSYSTTPESSTSESTYRPGLVSIPNLLSHSFIHSTVSPTNFPVLSGLAFYARCNTFFHFHNNPHPPNTVLKPVKIMSGP